MDGIVKTRVKILAIFIVGVVVVFCGLLMLKVPFISAAMDGPEFCGVCHSMEKEVVTYNESPHAGVATCGDCHIPHKVVSGSFYKAYTGAKDMVFTVAGHTENIKIGETGEQIVNNNCIECHMDALEEVGTTMVTDGRSCSDCHASVRHE